MFFYTYSLILINSLVHSPEDEQSILETSSCNQPVLFRTIYFSKENLYIVSPQTVFTDSYKVNIIHVALFYL